MDTVMTDEAVLARFRGALEAVYGAERERVVLFGSRARGYGAGVGLRYRGFLEKLAGSPGGTGPAGGVGCAVF
jgi:hypothetical protein